MDEPALKLNPGNMKQKKEKLFALPGYFNFSNTRIFAKKKTCYTPHMYYFVRSIENPLTILLFFIYPYIKRVIFPKIFSHFRVVYRISLNCCELSFLHVTYEHPIEQ